MMYICWYVGITGSLCGLTYRMYVCRVAWVLEEQCGAYMYEKLLREVIYVLYPYIAEIARRSSRTHHAAERHMICRNKAPKKGVNMNLQVQ